MLSVPGAKAVRGYSMFGDSFVYVLFDDGADLYWARSRVLEYLNQVQSRLPPQAKASLGPDAIETKHITVEIGSIWHDCRGGFDERWGLRRRNFDREQIICFRDYANSRTASLENGDFLVDCGFAAQTWRVNQHWRPAPH